MLTLFYTKRPIFSETKLCIFVRAFCIYYKVAVGSVWSFLFVVSVYFLELL